MEQLAAKKDVIERLQREVLSLQRLNKPSGYQNRSTRFGSLESAFPDKTFPTGVIHEFISYIPEEATATNGFIAGLLNCFMQNNGVCLWISTKRTVFPPVLKIFGIEPDKIIFVDLVKPKDALWAIEEALKCEVLSAVIGELQELNFTQSRRLQLAVEQSKVTGFIHRYYPRSENITACVTRWKIKPVASIVEENMPGIGLPRWDVQLLKVRNGKPATWQIEWSGNSFTYTGNSFTYIREEILSISGTQKLKTG